MVDLRTALSLFIARWFPPPPMLQAGATGVDVMKLQSLLNDNGAGLKEDGIFGPKTKAAVLAYQKSQGLVADSVVGPHTWGSLKG